MVGSSGVRPGVMMESMLERDEARGIPPPSDLFMMSVYKSDMSTVSFSANIFLSRSDFCLDAGRYSSSYVYFGKQRNFKTPATK